MSGFALGWAWTTSLPLCLLQYRPVTAQHQSAVPVSPRHWNHPCPAVCTQGRGTSPCHSCSLKHSSHPLLFLPVLTLLPFPRTSHILSQSNSSKGRAQQDGLFMKAGAWIGVAPNSREVVLPTSEQMNPPEPCVSLTGHWCHWRGLCRCGSGGCASPEPPHHRVPIRFLRSELLNSQYSSLYMPSTGALMLLTALHTCDQVRGHSSPGEKRIPPLAAVGFQCVLVAVLHVPCPFRAHTEGSGGGEVKP